MAAAVAPQNNPDINLVGGIGATVDMAGTAGALSISAGRFMLLLSPTPVKPGQPVSTIDSQTGRSIVAISFGQLSVRLTSIGISTDELMKIARSITPAKLQDLTTWFDADKVIPLH